MKRVQRRGGPNPLGKTWLVGLCLCGLVFAIRPGWAHDFWIEPSNLQPSLGESLEFRLWVGDHFQGTSYPRSSRHLKRFVLIGDKGTLPIQGRERSNPAGLLAIETKGFHTALYRSHRTFLQLPAPKFEAYLREEGLEWVSEERKRRKEEQEPGREWFSRCAKSLLWGGPRQSKAWMQPAGMPYEILPQVDPYTMDRKKPFSVQVLFRGKPLAGALVVAYHRGDKLTRLPQRTDKDGRARFLLTSPGFWLIKSVWMERQAPGGKAPWESLWASLTFALPPSPLASP